MVTGPQPSPFPDHFSALAGDYCRYRPQYPPDLFAYLASLAPARQHAWDCATGNGQAALGLAPWFQRVTASDASAAQIAAAQPAPNLEYRIAPAHASGLPSQSLDLISVAQALHWFDLDAFYAEARRVLKPTGVLAAWCYELMSIEESIDPLIQSFYRDILGPYWPPERAWVEQGYQGLPFPFQEIHAPAFRMTQDWNRHDCLGYLATWSAVKQYRAALHQDPLDWLAPRLAERWPAPMERKQVGWPLALRVGRPAAPHAGAGSG